MSKTSGIFILFVLTLCISSVLVFGQTSGIFHVFSQGEAGADGSVGSPFGNLDQALAAIAKSNFLYVIVYLHEGNYSLERTFALSLASCGGAKQIRFEAWPGELVRIHGARRLEPGWFTSVEKSDPVYGRIGEKARGNVLAADLKSHGITDYGTLRERGFFDKQVSHAELFVNKKRMQLARWPNGDFAWTKEAEGEKTFGYESDRPGKWKDIEDVRMYGMWMYEWSGRYVPLESIDAKAKRITIGSTVLPSVGVHKPWFAVNVIEELDQPGEWYLDRDTGWLYLWPEGAVDGAEIMLSMLGEDGGPLVRITDASNICFKGICFEACRASAIQIQGGANNVIDSCTIRNTGMAGVDILGGSCNGVMNSHIHNTGDQAVKLHAGDRRTLIDSKCFVKNCHIHHAGDWTRTASPGVLLMGCGHIVSHNVIHDIPHSAIKYLFPPGGNNNLIEYNEIYRACYETDDAGAIYDAWDWGSRGHVIRYNFIHDIHSPQIQTDYGVQGIYFDGFISGYTVYGNIFYDIERAGIIINGGRDHVIENNIFVKCEQGIHAARSGTVGIVETPNHFTNLLEGLGHFDHRNPPFASKFPRLLNIPDNYEDPAYELAKEPSGTVIHRNVSFENDHFLLEGHYPGGDVIGKFKIFENNLTGTDPCFVDEKNGNLALQEDSPALDLPGFEAIPFDEIGTEPAAPKVMIKKGYHELWDLDAVFIKGSCEPWAKIKSVRIVEMDQGYTRVVSVKENGMFSGLIPTCAINEGNVTIELIVEDPQGHASKPGLSNTIYVPSDDSNLVGQVWIDPETDIRMRGPVHFDPFVWPGEVPSDCPLERSKEITGIEFLGTSITYTGGDTWYPSWARDGLLYSPWTDGKVAADFCQSGWADSVDAETGHAVIIGQDPMNLVVRSLGKFNDPAVPYGGRYPCGSLLYEGVWYHGSYCLINQPQGYNWGTLGPFVGFRVSRDYGRTWAACPQTPARPLFGEHNRGGETLKIGAPHFVDFGQNMQHSPDKKAYLVGHGALQPDPKPRPANLSWITGDQIFMARVRPALHTINDPRAYEFFAGYGSDGQAIWTADFDKTEPLVDWNNNCGCVTMTYVPQLKKYLMFVTDGWPTLKKMNTWVAESDAPAGPFKLVTYMKDFGVQAYFVNVPGKFIKDDGKTLWLCYSGNFTHDQETNPPGGSYGMCFQKIRLITSGK